MPPLDCNDGFEQVNVRSAQNWM